MFKKSCILKRSIATKPQRLAAAVGLAALEPKTLVGTLDEDIVWSLRVNQMKRVVSLRLKLPNETSPRLSGTSNPYLMQWERRVKLLSAAMEQLKPRASYGQAKRRACRTADTFTHC